MKDKKIIVITGEALKQMKDDTARELFGLTKDEVLKRGLCINCKQPALDKCYSDAGRAEYKISGMCELCFDMFFKEKS